MTWRTKDYEKKTCLKYSEKASEHDVEVEEGSVRRSEMELRKFVFITCIMLVEYNIISATELKPYIV